MVCPQKAAIFTSRMLKTMKPPDHMHSGIWQVLDALPFSFYLKDTDCRFIYLNAAAAKSLGIDNPEIALGKTDEDFFERDVASRWVSQEKSIIQSGQQLFGQVEQEYLRGSTSAAPWVWTCKLPILSEDGTTVG